MKQASDMAKTFTQEDSRLSTIAMLHPRVKLRNIDHAIIACLETRTGSHARDSPTAATRVAL